MDQQNHFLRLLKEVKRKLWLQKAIHTWYVTLLACAGITLIWILSSRFLIIPFLDTKIVITIAIIISGFAIYLLWKRPSDGAAIRKFDQQGLHDRVITTYHFMEKKSDIAKLQRKDTLNKMWEVLPVIKEERIKWLQWKKLTITCCLFLLAYLCTVFPNDVMDAAKDKEKEIEIVEENKDIVEQFTEKHKEIADEETEETLDQLLEEVKQAEKVNEISQDLLQAEKQLNELKEQSNTSEKQLNELTEQLRSQGLENLAKAIKQMNAEQIEKQMAKLQEQMSDFSDEELEDLQNKLHSAAESLEMDRESLEDGELSKEQLEELMAQLEEQLKGLAESAGKKTELAQAQGDLQQLAKNMNQQLASAGLATPRSLSFANGTSTSGNTSGTAGQQAGNDQQGESESGSGSGSVAGTGSGSGSESGSGSGSGNGSGSGTGSGSGSGIGAGSGSGPGTGNGAGLGAGNHELSVPQQLEGQENQEVDNGELGAGPSEKQMAPNAPVLPGEVRSYGEVYEHYENTYRQAIERNNYPDHLQEIIKHYFSDIKPAEEN